MALSLTALPGYAERRVALVIGNGDYSNAARLPNPTNDSRAIAAELSRIGFEVFAYEDLKGQDFRAALGVFAEEALNADLAVVFYAGHGIEIGGENYLIPTDAAMKSESAAQFEAIKLDNILAAVRNAGKLGLVMLDACRDNPFATTMTRQNKTRAVTRGLAPITLEGEAGTLVSFAAQAGNTADDGDGQHSPYTEALLELLSAPNLEVGALFQKVTKVVKDKTGGRQKPMFRIQPPEELVYLVPANQSVEPRLTPAAQDDPLLAFVDAIQTGQRAPLEAFIARYPTHEKIPEAKRLLLSFAEQDLWDKIEKQDTISGYESYLIAFSDGRHVQTAKTRMAALQAAQQPEPAPQKVPEQAGPSFNCADASTPVEKTICQYPALAHQDVELARAFQQSSDRNEVTKEEQVLWVQLRTKICLSDVQDCVDVITRERIHALDTARGANTQSPSFDCQYARTAVEIAICQYGPLTLQDRMLARHYERAVAFSGQSEPDWVSERERTCGTKTGKALALCIADVTSRRIQQARPNGEDLHMGD